MKSSAHSEEKDFSLFQSFVLCFSHRKNWKTLGGVLNAEKIFLAVLCENSETDISRGLSEVVKNRLKNRTFYKNSSRLWRVSLVTR